MRHALTAIVLAALAACATDSGPPQWGYKPGESAPQVISEAEAETLTTQYRDFKLKREEISNAMAATRDPGARARYAQIIDDLSRSMEPLAYRLRSAGRPLP
ncbi:MAG: hypothetical protein KIS62_05675 [Ramlibacter sp.]|nr:hypothetical protein [Ramlibacter sp.]MCW5649212.1 hypothetical protein [Ramlibacter sp.]